jgi:hypothetical protein
MAAPNVTIKIADESFIASGSENISNTVGAAFSQLSNNLLILLGTSSEINAGYMSLDSLATWVNKYNTVFGAYAGKTASGAADNPFKGIPAGLTGVTLSDVKSPYANAGTTLSDGTIFNGITGAAATQWWSVANFLQYGGLLFLGGSYGATYTSLANPLMEKTTFNDVDVVFALDSTAAQATAVEAIVAAREYDCIGVVGASGSLSGYAGICGDVAGISMQVATNIYTRASGLGKYGVCVYGDKIHLGLDLNEDQTVRTPIVPDVAGCICRTDRDYAPWWSPAGFARGRILNLIRLADQPSVANQNILYDNKINYALTIPGEGTFLMGDKTMETSTSSFSRINVSRLFVYLVNTIGPLAKKFLFEFNDDTTRTLFRTSVDGILRTIQSQRGITEYQIICDETNNPPTVVDANQFVADILVKPAKSINYITIRFTNQNT